MLKKINITIPELTGDEERRLYIYLPESYRWSKKKRYPVLYMFDGHNVFLDSDATYGKSWGMKNFMDKSKTQMIVVGILAVPAAIMLLKLAIIFIQGLIAVFCEYVDF